MKKHLIQSAVATLLLLSLLLTACSRKETDYADDLSCAELMETVEKQIPVQFGYETFGTEQIQFYFENTKAHDDACLRYSTLSENINEIGIFHTPDKQSREEIEDLVEDYLEELQEEQSAFIASYAAKELPKLEGAEFRSFGNYTVYAILDKEDRDLVFETVEKKLTEAS